MRYINWILRSLVFLVAVLFVSLNSKKVSINYMLGSSEIYVPLLLLLTLVFGVFLGVLALLPSLFRAKQAERIQRKKLEKIQEPVE